MTGLILTRSASVLLLLVMLYLEALVEPFLLWFSPDLFFLTLVLLVLVYKTLDFVSLFFVTLFYDIFTNNVFGGTVVSLSIILYFMEWARFHHVRFSFLGSSAQIAFFFLLFIVVRHIISYGFEGLFITGSLYMGFQSLTTLIAWMIFWRIQAQHG